MSTGLNLQELGGRLRSVYVQSLLIMAATTLIVATVVTVQSFRVSNQVGKTGLLALATQSTQSAANAIGGAVRFNKPEDAQTQIEALIGGSDGMATDIILLNLAGETLAQFSTESTVSSPLSSLALESLESKSIERGNDGLDFAVPVVFGSDGVQVGVLAVSWTTAPIAAAMRQDKLEITFIGTATFLILLVAATFLLNRSLGSPLKRIEMSVQNVANGHYDENIPDTNRKDEIGRLARHLDSMRAGLIAARTISKQVEIDKREQDDVLFVLTSSLKKLMSGDLTANIDTEFAEKYAQLRSDFNETVRTLGDTIASVVQVSASIENGANEISQASDDLSNRTENQAATLEQTAAALDELTASVKSAAAGAKSVEIIVREAQSEAKASGEVVGEAISAMTEIETSSNQIFQIIGVIDDIAFQTNLLALNAGIEAARAGEAGKGFAVVASEVRALAQRSTEAANEIKTLISGSTKQVERGVDLVGSAGTALSSIVERVVHISELVRNMATGTSEQAVGLGEINIGVNQLDQVTQQNAAMVEEATAASHTLKLDATRLQDLVRNFKTSSTTNDQAEHTHLDPSRNVEHVQFRRA